MNYRTAVELGSMWTVICRYAQLQPERGIAALVGGEQVAVFRLHDDRLYAIGNWDPIGGAHVLSRGIVGTRGDAPIVTSPLFKQAYDLRTGECLDEPSVRVPIFAVRHEAGMVEVAAVAADRAGETVGAVAGRP